MGRIFMLNFIRLAPGMRIGINVDYLSICYHQLDANRETSLEYKYMDVSLGSKIGPSFSYSPVKHLAFDIYGKINPVWIGAANSQLVHVDNSDQTYLGYLGIKYSLGLNIRYAALITGFEFNPGSMRFKNTSDGIDHDPYLYNSDGTNKTKIPCYNITIGLCF
jgi:hypothetical protein